MNWSAKIFAYCERGSDPTFWAEPVNALTNVAFIIAGGLAYRAWAKHPDRQTKRIELAFIALIVVIGVGSFLFHTTATRWAALADVLPITIFMIAYLAYALRRLLALPSVLTAILTIMFMVTLPLSGVAAGRAGGFFAGSASYVPALLALVVTAAVLRLRHHPAAGRLGLAAIVFALSLTLRTLDQVYCGGWTTLFGIQIGTHFAWHILNAIVLYNLAMAAVNHGRSVKTGAGDAKKSA